MADSFVHIKGTDESHDFIDSRRLKKKDETVRFFKKILKGLLDCNEMLLANFLPMEQNKLLNYSHLSVTLQLPHISLIWELIVLYMFFPTQEVNFAEFPKCFSRHLGGIAI